ncbi:DUF1566 domain-containing protein [Pseudomonas sp. MOB-449]|nr:DUF1566 domain-containing protein [Pseudomonas sp. MOB-449]
MTQNLITLSVGQTTIESPSAALVRQVLEQACGLDDGFVLPAAAITRSDYIPALGQYWPGEGGVNAGLMRGHDGTPDYYLIVPFGDDAEFEDLAYGGRGTEVDGAASPWDGLANTRALLASGNEHPAAKAADGFTREGHLDFYLPARRELQLCEANVPEVFSKVWHWSSTQYSAHGAYYVYFTDGYQYYGVKYYEGRVRPVRRKFL